MGQMVVGNQPFLKYWRIDLIKPAAKYIVRSIYLDYGEHSPVVSYHSNIKE